MSVQGKAIRAGWLRLLASAGLALVGGLAAGSAHQQAGPGDAAQLKEKIATISQRGATPSPEPQRTTVTESEVNAYLAYEMADYLPSGLVTPTISILGEGRVAAHAVVDLDRVRQERNPTSLFSPANYLTGRVPVTAAGIVRTGDGVARFQMESASVAGVPIPKLLLQQIVTHYSRSDRFPSGVSLDDPFALPARIREIQVEPGQAIVIQ